MPYKHKKKAKAYNKLYYEKNAGDVLDKRKNYYKENKPDILHTKKSQYKNNQAQIKQARKKHYKHNQQQMLLAKQTHYNKNKPEILHIRKAHYKNNSNKILQKRKKYYLQKQSSLSVWYKKNKNKLIAKSCKYYKQNKSARKAYAKRHYALQIEYIKDYNKKHKKEKSCYDKVRYAIKEPRFLDGYIKKIQKNLRCDKEVCDKIVEAFTFNNSESTDHSYSEISLVASKIVSKRLIGNAIQVRRKRVGSLLKTHREIEKIVIKSKDDFGEEGHTCTTEPYYYDASYSLTHHQLYPINKYGKCVLVAPTYTGRGTNVWKCTPECKAIPQWEVDAIVKIRKAFDGSIPALRKPCHPRAVKAVQIYTFPSL
jgi:hypothetical protein